MPHLIAVTHSAVSHPVHFSAIFLFAVQLCAKQHECLFSSIIYTADPSQHATVALKGPGRELLTARDYPQTNYTDCQLASVPLFSPTLSHHT